MNIRARLLLAVPVVGLSFAESSARAQIAAPLPKPSFVITATKIESVQFTTGTSIACGGTSVGLGVALHGGNKLPGSGNIQIVRFNPTGTNQVVTAPYSLGVSEKKTFTVNVPFTWNCNDTAPARFSVKIVPSTGGWDGIYKDLNPTGVTFSEKRAHDAELFSTADANKSKVTALQINGGLAYSGGALKFTASVTANSTAASSGKVIVTKKFASGQYANVLQPFSLPAGGTAKIDVLAPAWGSLTFSDKIPSFRATLDGQGPGGWDGWWVDLLPANLVYTVSSGNVNSVPT